jgi:ectoine hydroxylase
MQLAFRLSSFLTGYWQQDGCILPDMASCLIAVNAATQANGCLHVLSGSHKLGVVDHGRVGGQTGADEAAVQWAEKRCEKVFFEAEAGDALFFHSNLLHASAPNLSPHSRWSLICTYNTRTNNPIAASHHPLYTPLKKVRDEDVLKMGKGKGSYSAEAFIKSGEDKTSVHTAAKQAAVL